jgi:hypothetical protein
MSQGLGFTVPRFEDYTEEECISLIDTGIELLGMIRDGDSNSDDIRARELYRNLFTTDSS